MSNMIQNLVLGKSGIPLLKKFLDLSSFRHKLISGNIANVSTPGFKSCDIDFHGELKKAAGKNKKHLAGHLTHPVHIPLGRSRNGTPEIIVNKSKLTNGINSVDIEREVAALAENQIYFSVGARLLAKKFTGLKSAIKSK